MARTTSRRDTVVTVLRITALAGGIGGARFLRGLRRAVPDASITVIGNTADDIRLHGLHISPDLDTIMYTLGGGIHEGQGWGRADESFTVAGELEAYGAEPRWFTLGDRDIATHLVRTEMLAAGYPLSAVTEALCDRWQPGVHLVPMTDDRVETHVVIRDLDETRAIHFQEWWVRLHAKVPAERILVVGDQREHLALHLADQRTRTERVALGRRRLGQAVRLQTIQVHRSRSPSSRAPRQPAWNGT